MPEKSGFEKLSSWSARIVGAVFLLLVAVGWWDESQARREMGGALAGDPIWSWAIYTHLLPLLLISTGYVLGFSRPILAAIAFGIFAGLQALSVGSELIYLPLVVLPPLVVGVLFLSAWISKNKPANRN